MPQSHKGVFIKVYNIDIIHRYVETFVCGREG